ncbi:MAG: hypothetical protein LC745_02130 [Planctomycetia bacterium]|nr:hypothetical protein [Planctomycetia bacterium]
MSIVTRPRRLNETFVPNSFGDDVPANPAARHCFEAPERAASRREAPESRTDCSAEAPDAGDGRASYLEHEFTHGRSQS